MDRQLHTYIHAYIHTGIHIFMDVCIYKYINKLMQMKCTISLINRLIKKKINGMIYIISVGTCTYMYTRSTCTIREDIIT
jgi:hypothetical protein